MAILQPADRRQGYGHRALSLQLVSLAQHKVVDAVYADVLKTNRPSQRLCAYLGFVPAEEGATRLRLVKSRWEGPRLSPNITGLIVSESKIHKRAVKRRLCACIHG